MQMLILILYLLLFRMYWCHDKIRRQRLLYMCMARKKELGAREQLYLLINLLIHFQYHFHTKGAGRRNAKTHLRCGRHTCRKESPLLGPISLATQHQTTLHIFLFPVYFRSKMRSRPASTGRLLATVQQSQQEQPPVGPTARTIQGIQCFKNIHKK